jgi:hypothetical protein
MDGITRRLFVGGFWVDLAAGGVSGVIIARWEQDRCKLQEKSDSWLSDGRCCYCSCVQIVKNVRFFIEKCGKVDRVKCQIEFYSRRIGPMGILH